jgi:hypothetical protein
LVELKIRFPSFISEFLLPGSRKIICYFCLKDTTVVTWKKEKSGGLYGCKSNLIKIPWGEYPAESGPQKTGYILRPSVLSLSVCKLSGRKNRILRIPGQTGILSAKGDVSRKKTWGTINCRGYGVGGF